jgi:hypothetical protein
MTPAQHLAMAYPALAGAGTAETTWALSVAQDYRPRCLSEERQNLAQAHYAAYLLMRRAAEMGGGAGEPSGPVVEEREGDLTVKYAEGGSSGGPDNAYASWQALNAICLRGAIITRFG